MYNNNFNNNNYGGGYNNYNQNNMGPPPPNYAGGPMPMGGNQNNFGNPMMGGNFTQPPMQQPGFGGQMDMFPGQGGFNQPPMNNNFTMPPMNNNTMPPMNNFGGPNNFTQPPMNNNFTQPPMNNNYDRDAQDVEGRNKRKIHAPYSQQNTNYGMPQQMQNPMYNQAPPNMNYPAPNPMFNNNYGMPPQNNFGTFGGGPMPSIQDVNFDDFVPMKITGNYNPYSKFNKAPDLKFDVVKPDGGNNNMLGVDANATPMFQSQMFNANNSHKNKKHRDDGNWD